MNCTGQPRGNGDQPGKHGALTWPGGKGHKWVLLCSEGRVWEPGMTMVSSWAQHVWVAEMQCLHPQEMYERCCGGGPVAAAGGAPGQEGVIKTFLIGHLQSYRLLLKKKKTTQHRNVIHFHFVEVLCCCFRTRACWAAVCSVTTVVILPCSSTYFSRRRLIFWKQCFVSTSCKETCEKLQCRHLCFTKWILHQHYTLSLRWTPNTNC